LKTLQSLRLDREMMYNSHRLSHQQINDFLGEKNSGSLLPEKMELMQQVQEFVSLTDILRNGGIEFISIKGPLLSYRIYGDAACRRSKDFDFLMDFDVIGKTVSLLQSIGFKPGWYDWPADPDIREFKGELRNQFHLLHPEKQFTVELHWKLLAFQPVQKDIFENLVTSNLADLVFAGRKFKVLNPEMELLYLVIHGGLHSWRRLKWLVDVHEIAVRGLYNEQKFRDLVKICRAERLVALSTEILKVIYPGKPTLPEIGKVPGFLVRHSLKKIEKESDLEYDSFAEAISYFTFVMKAFPGFLYKIKTLKYLYQSMSDDGASKRSVFSVIFSLIRPVKFFKKRYQLE
jgi:hypothetical protein